MPAMRITMRKIRDVLRLRLEAGLSYRQISASTKISIGAIQKLLSSAQALSLSWPLPEELDDRQLAQLFYPGADTRVSSRYQMPDWLTVHQELKSKGTTKLLLWEEYTQQYPNRCYSYRFPSLHSHKTKRYSSDLYICQESIDISKTANLWCQNVANVRT